MSAKMHVVLEGLPERVQETADLLDRAFPGLMTWRRFAEPGRDHAVRLEGEATERNGTFPRPSHLTNPTAASGKAWKLRARQEIAESGGTSRHRGIPGHGAVL